MTAKLMRLMELCRGDARAAIKPFTVLDPMVGYPRAKRTLQHRFGGVYAISKAMVGKIFNGPKIKQNHVKDLVSFTDDVKNCVETF